MSIHKAMLGFAAEFAGAEKSGSNPHFKSRYHTLEDVDRASRKLLAKHGLYMHHYLDAAHVVTQITHGDSNEQLRSYFPISDGLNVQQTVSWISYGKRINAMALLGVAEADDDGNVATAASRETLAALRDYLAEMADDLTPAQSAYFKKHPVDSMTEAEAQKILSKLRTNK